MPEAVKISALEIENVKRVKAVALEPTPTGITIIGGGNGQGKTSVLDAITWALGGDRYRPSEPAREGSATPPKIHIQLSNGLIVERSGKNGALRVTDPEGRRGGQQLLNEFVEQLALDLPRFLGQSAKEKADTLLRVIGVGDELKKLDQQAQQLYYQRHAIGQEAVRKEKHAEELPYYPDAPAEPVSASELIRQQQDILARNGQRRMWIENYDHILEKLDQAERAVEFEEKRLAEIRARRDELRQASIAAQHSPAELAMESTEELEASIAQVEEINAKVRANAAREQAAQDAAQLRGQYDELTGALEQVRADRLALLHGAALPLEGLSVEDGELTYQGRRWDCLSSADQLRVGTAIVRALNPRCGFVLLDKLEQMDPNTLRGFSAWLESEGLQAIATRVSTGEECTIIIEDGYAVRPEPEAPAASWKAGVF